MTISPWALREGVLLWHIEDADPGWWWNPGAGATRAAASGETARLRVVRPD